MTPDEARERFERADAAVYLDEDTVILLSAFAQRHGLRTLREALTVVLDSPVPAPPTDRSPAAETA